MTKIDNCPGTCFASDYAACSCTHCSNPQTCSCVAKTTPSLSQEAAALLEVFRVRLEGSKKSHEIDERVITLLIKIRDYNV